MSFLKKPIIYIDVDGVVADLHTCLEMVHRLDDRTYESFPKGKERWDLEKITGLTYKELFDPISPTMIRNLPKTPHADIIMEMLDLRTHAWDTAFLTNPIIGRYDARREWLYKYWPHIPRVFTELKHYLCRGPNTLLIDDYDKNCESWVEAGGTAIVYPRVWNSRWEEEESYTPDKLQSEVKAWFDMCNECGFTD